MELVGHNEEEEDIHSYAMVNFAIFTLTTAGKFNIGR